MKRGFFLSYLCVAPVSVVHEDAVPSPTLPNAICPIHVLHVRPVHHLKSPHGQWLNRFYNLNISRAPLFLVDDGVTSRPGRLRLVRLATTAIRAGPELKHFL